jgi:hypothetical protein
LLVQKFCPLPQPDSVGSRKRPGYGAAYPIQDLTTGIAAVIAETIAAIAKGTPTAIANQSSTAATAPTAILIQDFMFSAVAQRQTFLADRLPASCDQVASDIEFDRHVFRSRHSVGKAKE